LTGWNAVKSRVEQLGLTLNDEEVSIFICSYQRPVIKTFFLFCFDRSRTQQPKSRSLLMFERSLWMTLILFSVSTTPVSNPVSSPLGRRRLWTVFSDSIMNPLLLRLIYLSCPGSVHCPLRRCRNLKDVIKKRDIFCTPAVVVQFLCCIQIVFLSCK
jgi:hypothetical protein